MDPSTLVVDFLELLLVPRPESISFPYAVNISSSGHMSLNQKLYDELVKECPNLEFEFRIQTDRKLLALRVSDQPNYKFPKGGRIKDVAFSRTLVEYGIPLPARYKVAWNQAANAWVGVLVESQPLSGKTALTQSLSPAPAKERRRKNR